MSGLGADFILMSTYQGYLQSKEDAVYLLEACLNGKLVHSCRGPQDGEATIRNALGQYHFNSTIFAQYYLGIGIRIMLPPTPLNFGAHIGIKRPYGDFRILDILSDRALPN
jgi:hypothetical protein